MKPQDERTVQELLADDAVFKALQVGSKRAVRIHKLLGHPVATSKDGKVIWIQPEDIQIDAPPAAPAYARRD